MSRKTPRLPGGRCRRCEFHGLMRRAILPLPSNFPGPLVYCQECFDWVVGKEKEENARRENREPLQITYHDKEAT